MSDIDEYIRKGLRRPKDTIMINPQLKEVQDIHEQITKLQERAALLLTEGRSEAIEQIKAAMAAYKITPVDLGLVLKAAPRGPRPIKYRDPASGQTWTGQGVAPKWIEGKNRDDFVIAKPAS